MTDVNNIILNNTQVEQKIRRIAFQIYESNSNETEIIIAGIADNGYFLAEKISTVLSEVSPIKITLCKVSIDKRNPISPITTSINNKEYQNKALVLVDDVLNSGTTLIYGVKHFLEVPLKRFKTAVLVNRNHKKYPVKADFKGISLSTSIKEHVVVEFKTNETIAYLT
ncbi:pyrimidine operon attenuation protein/uracil phosphoribosyltransferase [Tenacibaculum gallaicum]|uniref:Pyrimidine operon attenuation protein/uracil phosphoribosyltransferase n=1 Tax=Tenacibaculum gallaicum TaxID=561505 RepID=A0A3E0HQY2_9FLAO|nr:phosphoribosyltransferase family protein [Tenacibaculum gallaicum]REH48801.1 pyrimidine operon attenuation protein/uracil phosphoribosyltransferase [Tenacibaculum gallaicum]